MNETKKNNCKLKYNMRNNLFYSVLMLCSACIFAGCNDGDKEEEKVPVPAVIQGKVYSFDVNAEAERWKR